MKCKNRIIAICCLALFLNIQGAYAASHTESDPNQNAIQQMAEIMLNLNHYPDASEKALLKSINENSAVSDHTRTLANTILNIKHYAATADKERLQDIINNDSVPEKVRKLAGIIQNIAHMPSSADKENLLRIME